MIELPARPAGDDRRFDHGRSALDAVDGQAGQRVIDSLNDIALTSDDTSSSTGSATSTADPPSIRNSDNSSRSECSPPSADAKRSWRSTSTHRSTSGSTRKKSSRRSSTAPSTAASPNR